MKGLTIQCDVHFTRGQRTRKVIQEGPPPEPDWRKQRRLWKCLAFDQGVEPVSGDRDRETA